jgi:hypothetical protein
VQTCHSLGFSFTFYVADSWLRVAMHSGLRTRDRTSWPTQDCGCAIGLVSCKPLPVQSSNSKSSDSDVKLRTECPGQQLADVILQGYHI